MRFAGLDPDRCRQVAEEIRRKALAAETPLGQFAEPEEVAHGILFLSSEEARYVTGAQLVIDGGYSA